MNDSRFLTRPAGIVRQDFMRYGEDLAGGTQAGIFLRLGLISPHLDGIRTAGVQFWTGVFMDFGAALAALKSGKKVSRSGWNGKGMWINLQTPDANSKMSLPYVYMKTVDDKLVPWLASQTDILAEDWGIV